MKNILLSCLFLGCSYLLIGQSKKPPISVAYFSQVGFQPGAKIGTSFSLKKLSTSTQKEKNRHLFVSPQIGFFSWPNNHSNLLLNADIGIKKQKEGQSAFSAVSLGLGYLHEFQVSAIAINLGDGNQSTSRTNYRYFLPTINYTFGNRLNSTIDWYSKIGVGQRIRGEISNTMTILLELGVQFNL